MKIKFQLSNFMFGFRDLLILSILVSVGFASWLAHGPQRRHMSMSNDPCGKYPGLCDLSQFEETDW